VLHKHVGWNKLVEIHSQERVEAMQRRRAWGWWHSSSGGEEVSKGLPICLWAGCQICRALF